MFKIPQKVISDSQKFKDNLEKFISGKINSSFFKGIRVPWGNYAQRGGEYLMSRLRIPAGILLPDQLKAIGEASIKFGSGRMHLTTRQDIQIHDVKSEDTYNIIEYLLKFNISPRGGGGNTVRNVTSCYLSGICEDEKYEVYKIVWGLSEYILSLEESFNLPRKFKISFSACEKDCSHSGVNDLGFIYLKNGFKVLCGGGMGAKAAIGKVLHENIQPDEIGYIVKSAINVFNKYGDRKNRNRNRLRFLIEDLGWDKFIELYQKEYEAVKKDEYIVLRSDDGISDLPKVEIQSDDENLKNDKDYQLFKKYNVKRQKQAGYYFIQLRIPAGEITGDELISLADLGQDIKTMVFRVTQRQNLIVSNIPADKIKFAYNKIKEIFKNFLFPETVYDVLTCKGASTCNLGICNAIALAPEITDGLLKENLDSEKLKNIKININGCPNSCGQHPLGTIALSGLARKVYGRTVPFYKIYVGGKIDAEETSFAQEVGIVPARNVPKLLPEFIAVINKNSSGDAYKYIVSDGKNALKELIKKHSYIPSYEEDKAFYVDFGRSEDFSLDGLTQGECGAGAIDMIEADLASSKASLDIAASNGFDLANIKDSVLYSSRALLVVKGVDPKDDVGTINSFIDKFIKTEIADSKFGNLKDIFNQIIAGGIAPLDAYNYAKELHHEMKHVYSIMDNNFNFPSRNAIIQGEIKSADLPKSVVYDLRGTPCPINYVKAKIKLEDMEIGDLLEIYLDEGEPIDNVPKSLLNDGHEITKTEHIDNYYIILVKKTV